MLQFLFSPTKQFLYDSGKLLAGGKIYVYLKDTQNLATLYDGETGDLKSNPIILDANGRASVRADDVNEYRLEIYTPYDTLVYTCNAFYAEGGEGGGTFIVRHDSTLSGNGTSQNPLGVLNIPLAVDETMTAYTDMVEGVSSLVLGVNGDWFNDTFGSALNDKVDWTTFSACCSAVKGGLDQKLDVSAYDLSNYYNKQETTYLLSNYYNKQEIDETVNVINELKQDKLTFEYNENSAISSINGSALVGEGGGSGGDCPWISGAKILADTQTMTDNMIIQLLSSFTLSGNHNHCIAVKGGTYRFPNAYELGDRIATTNFFMATSSMSSYLPVSSFSSYTASIQNSLNSNWDYTNSAYSLSINNFYNKLDASAFSAYTADQGNTYTLVGGDFVNISSNDEEETTTISVTGVPGQGEIDDLNSVVNNISSVVVNNSGDWNDIRVYQQNSATYLTAISLPDSASWNEATNVVQTNSSTWSNGGDSYTALTSNSAIWNDITVYQSHSGDYITAHQIIPSSKWEDASDTVQTNSAQWAENTGDTAVNLYVYNNSAINNEVNNVVTTNSGTWNTVGDKLDYSAFTAYTATDETYTLIGGQDIGISSDDVNKETTIYFTGSNGDEEVNNVVRNFSANGTWLTSHQDISNLMPKSESANFYPMTGNPSGFLTQHQTIPSAKWENASDVVQTNSAQWAENTGDTAVNNFVYNNSAAITSVNNSGALWNAVYDLVATYSAKWLINGDV